MWMGLKHYQEKRGKIMINLIVVDSTFINRNHRLFKFGFYYATTDVRIEKETLVYPLMSFISELGGSLGLFVGFSLLTVWDAIIFMYQIIKHKLSKVYNV